MLSLYAQHCNLTVCLTSDAPPGIVYRVNETGDGVSPIDVWRDSLQGPGKMRLADKDHNVSFSRQR